MKEEEFNEFLRQKAEGFEITPSSGSFASVMRKMENKRKKRGLVIWLPLLVAVTTGILAITVQSSNNIPATPVYNNTAASTPQQSTTTDKKQGDVNIVDNTIGSQPAGTTATTMAGDNFAGSQSRTPQHTTHSSIKTPEFTETPAKEKQPDVSTVYSEVIDDKKQNLVTAIDSSETVIAQNDIIIPPTETIEDNKSTELVELVETPDPSTQSIKPEKKSKGCNCGQKWAVSAFYSPFAADYYKSFTKSEIANEPAPPANSISTSNYQRYSYEKGYTYANGFETGAKANYRFTEHFGLSAGVSFSKRTATGFSRITAIENDSVEDTYYDPSTNQPYTLVRNVYQGEKIVDESYTTTLQSIKLPVALTYSAQKNRWGFDAEIGGSVDYLFSAKTETKNYIKPAQFNLTTAAENETVSTEPTNNYRKWNIMASVAAFITYKPGKCWGIYIGPRAAAALRPINNNTANGVQKELPLFLGFETGLKINL
jgi:hypothetical protein